MQMIKLEPDDVLKGAGGYRDETVVECPVCGEETEIETEVEEFECDGCGTGIDLNKPFS